MRKIINFEVVDLGIQNTNYFQGFGASYSRYEHATYGIGYDFKEALDDCLEQIATINDVGVITDETIADLNQENAGKESLGRYAKRHGTKAEKLMDHYYHVGIRYNLDDDK